MPYKIILLGKEKRFYRFVKQALSDYNYELTFKTLDEIENYPHELATSHLVILDTLSYSPESLAKFSFLKENLQSAHSPILALVNNSPPRLRYRLVQMGITDYVTAPFDMLDLQVRVRNILNLNSNGRVVPDRSKSSRLDLTVLSALNELLQDLIQLQVNFVEAHFFQKALKTLYNLLKADFVFYFQVKNTRELMLKYEVPEGSIQDVWIMPISDFPTVVKAVRLKELTVLNTITRENPLVTYLKSYLNVRVTSFALLPVVVDRKTRGILFVIKSDEKPLITYHYEIMQGILYLITHAIQLRRVKRVMQNQFDARVWQFSYEFLDHIIQQLNFGVLVIGEDLRIKYLNTIAAELLQVSKEAALYKPLSDFLSDTSVQCILDSRKALRKTFERPELEFRGPNNEKILIGFTVQDHVDVASKEKGYIISLKDITYNKELQEEMQRMERLASLGVMASGIAHEIRNPLAGIKAIAQTFQEEFTPDDPKTEFVTRIIRQVNRLDEMLKSLFSYARPQKPNRRFCQIESIIQDVISLLRQKFREQNIKLTESIHPDLPEIFVDSSQIQQVLLNLMLNSIEAIESRGEVQITVRPVGHSYPKFSRKPFYELITHNPYVEVHIRDTGCGIAPENLKQIFNPFFTTKSLGTGLGLSIVYQIVKENNGVIYFESEVNRGTDCHLFLPGFNNADQGSSVKI